ncbi:MAG TPA: hypothetical protein ENJ35_03675 [Gammaproteobacteria bacterium]|nr:hypothetical protein [Gammaproteobacteria bacterium]
MAMLKEATKAYGQALPYTHAKLAPADATGGSDDTVNMLEQIVKKRREKEMKLLARHKTSGDILKWQSSRK